MNRETLLARLQGQAAAVAEHAVARSAELEKSYAAGKWTVRQLLSHLADAEFVNLWRFCKAVAEPDSSVPPFDENRWAAALDYGERPAELSRELFLGARRMLMHHVQSLSGSHLEHANVHPEKGRMSGWQWASLTVGHCDHHLSQIAAAREGRPWVKPEHAQAHLFGA